MVVDLVFFSVLMLGRGSLNAVQIIARSSSSGLTWLLRNGLVQILFPICVGMKHHLSNETSGRYRRAVVVIIVGENIRAPMARPSG